MVTLEFWQLLILAGVVAGTQWAINRARSMQKIRLLEQHVAALESKVTLLESAHLSSPLPMWMKDVNFVMRSFNHAYTDMFLTPRGIKDTDYLHKFDEQVWPDDIAKEFRNNDLLVMNTDHVFDTTETIIDHQGRRKQIRVIKFPQKIGEVIIGIAGIAVPGPDEF